MTKECTKCHSLLDISCFSKKASNRDGLRNHCKKCSGEYTKKYVSQHLEWKKEYDCQYRQLNKEKLKAYNEVYLEKYAPILKKKSREYREKNFDKIQAAQKEYYLKHRDSILARRLKPEVKERIREYEKEWRSQPLRRVSGAVSRYLRFCLGKNKNGMHWEKLVGFSLQDLKLHLESLFQNGMTWGNYGSEWEIDHIIPVASFCFTSPVDDDFKKCWSLSNLQPLWKSDNRHKSATMPIE